MPLSSLEYIHHIVDEIKYLIAESNGLSKAEFLRNEDMVKLFQTTSERFLVVRRLCSYCILFFVVSIGQRNHLCHCLNLLYQIFADTPSLVLYHDFGVHYRHHTQ